jgi:DNA mismatch repair protein MutS
LRDHDELNGEPAGSGPSPASAAPAAISPLMAQYEGLKAQHPDALLFFRMGDFYELFFDDAVTAAAALDIALTKRGKHLGEDIPMCGVPVASHEPYLARLIRKGYRVAIAEQVEEPHEARKRGAKALVRREVVRIVTAGTVVEDQLLEARHHNFLAALAEAKGTLALAWLDISTGELMTQSLSESGLAAALDRCEPRELLLAEGLAAKPAIAAAIAPWQPRLAILPASRFDSINGAKRLSATFDVAALDGFGTFDAAELAAAGALIDYVELTQRGRLPRLLPPVRLTSGAFLEIDGATRRNLELAATLSGERAGSLLATIDRTLTPAGARRLAARLAAPLTDIAAIERRLDEVSAFVAAPGLRQGVREELTGCADLDRALSRLTLGRGGPRDLAAVRESLSVAGRLAALLADAEPALRPYGAALVGHADIVRQLADALADSLPISCRDGGFIAPGFDQALDEARNLREDGRQRIAALEARYVEMTGVTSLKIRHNATLGYYIEVPAGRADRLPTATFMHRQTMANAMRFITTELAELEQRILGAADEALRRELALYDALAAEVVARADAIGRAAAALADLDVAAALADLAEDFRYCRPHLDDGCDFDVTGGRHPVVETALRAQGNRDFIANDCRLMRGQRLWLLTGPNMAGKSTFLRQNALIVLMAQMGSFVPAESARIGIVDRLFSRVGAADDLARGRSTFMVEMIETAAILNQAGPRAFVILDEIGRGTATFDGLSIAWAAVEYLHDVNRCRALFATHFHELTAVANRLPNLACFTMRVKEWRGQVVFLHDVVPGAADRSYGIHVARLAGLPKAVLARAEQLLQYLESDERSSALTRLADDLPLFAAASGGRPGLTAASPALPAAISEIQHLLDSIRPDELTPRQALDVIYQLKSLLESPP